MASEDVDAGDAVWNITELEQLMTFISSSLMMSFPLYIICKHNHICGVEVSVTCRYCIVELSGLQCCITYWTAIRHRVAVDRQ